MKKNEEERSPPVDYNWRYIPKVPLFRLLPMWSEGVEALQQWTYRIVDTSNGYISCEPLLPNREVPKRFAEA
jgi:hypothetical protein